MNMSLPRLRPTVRLFRILLISYLVYGTTLFFMQRTLVYPGAKLPPPSRPAGLARMGEPLRLSLPDGPVTARFIAQADNGTRHPVVIVCHGNAELADNLSPRFEELYRMGVSVLLVEYPGFCGMPGTATEDSTTAAAVAAYDALLRRVDVDPARIVVMGRSLGGGVAASLSRQRPLRAMILQSTFTSMRPFSARYLLPGFFVRDVYDNMDALRRFNGPVLITHGRRDRVVPFDHGEQLAAAAGHARFVSFDAGHSDILDQAAFWQAIEHFLVDERIIAAPRKGN